MRLGRAATDVPITGRMPRGPHETEMDDAGHVVVSDGKPVYLHDDGKDVTFDAPAYCRKDRPA